MASLRTSFALFAAFFVTLASLGRARASIVVFKEGGAVSVSARRIAISRGIAQGFAWEQLQFGVARGELIWIVPVFGQGGAAGWIDAADDRWLDALSEVTAKTVDPPASLGCAVGRRDSLAAARSTRSVRRVERSLGTMSPLAAIDRLRAQGFVLSEGQRLQMRQLQSDGFDVALLALDRTGEADRTQVIRLHGLHDALAPISFAPAEARTEAYLIGPGAQRLAGVQTAELDLSRLVWLGSASNYRQILGEALASAPLARTFASYEGLMRDLPDARGGSLPSLARRYLAPIGPGGQPLGIESSCAARLAVAAGATRVVGSYCPQAAPWPGAGSPPACSPVVGDTIPASSLVCGVRDDLAAAFSGKIPSGTWIVRFDGLRAVDGGARRVELAPSRSIAAHVEARTGGCDDQGGGFPAGPGGGPGGSVGGGDQGSTTTPGSDPSSPTTPVRPARRDSSGEGCSGGVMIIESCSSSSSGGGCGGSSSDSGDSCDGDSSSSSDDGCGSSSSSSDSGCGSSSSSSSSGCGSSSSSSKDDGCGSSSSSGSSSGCGSSGKGADDGCRIARRAPRVRMSALIYGLVAVATVLRRAGRRR